MDRKSKENAAKSSAGTSEKSKQDAVNPSAAGKSKLRKRRSGAGKRVSSTSQATKLEESIDDSQLFLSGWYEGEEYEGSGGISKVRMRAALSRTSMLLEDYRKFKAARVIQTSLRGWFARHMMDKRKRSAAIIQRAWRGFAARRLYYRKLEQKLQDRIIEHYNRQATKIQALWRGYWVRENVHDQYRLTRMQVRAAEDLLHCVAFKLHHLLRTHQIPGVYSLRNSHCLSKVEKVLAAMTFKEHNEKVRVARLRRENAIQVAKRKHPKSNYQSVIPYSGQDLGICEPKCCALYKEEDADKKMFKILSMYEKVMATNTRVQRNQRNRPKSPDKKSSSAKKLPAKTKTTAAKASPVPPKTRKKGRGRGADFCTDVVESMKRWKILGENNVTVNRDVFKKPENVEGFLKEIQSINSLMKDPRCHCFLKPNDVDMSCTSKNNSNNN